MTQLPTVGRVVHYYGRQLFWHTNMEFSVWYKPRPTHEFSGPFVATVVYVGDDGAVNLRVDYPTPCFGSERIAEIVEDVPMSDQASHASRWTWPPRVP